MRSVARAIWPCILVGFSTGLAAVEAAEITAPDRPDVADGRALYQRYCASCHGQNAEGQAGWQQPNERGELPAPPHDATGHTWRHSDADLHEMISKGWRDPFNKTETLTMPGFEGQLSLREIGAVTAYLKTLWSADQRLFQSEQSQGRPLPPEAN